MIKKDTIEYRLVSLIGLAGEIKTDELYMVISPSENNYKAVLKLISNQPGKNHDYYPVNYIQSIDLNKGQQSKCNKYTSNLEN